MKIQTLQIKDLTPDPQNARQHDDKNLKAIQGSLKQFGQRKPIVITEDGVIVAGNGTVEAAKRLGWLEIQAVTVPGDWTPEQTKAFALADNRTAELAAWSPEVLAAQLVELEASGFQIEEFGFEKIEAENQPTIQGDDDFDMETAPKRSALGDYWTVGRHHVICGDSSRPETIQRFKSDFDAVVTDPPYGIGASSWKRLGKGKINNNEGSWDDTAPDISFVLDLAPIQIIWGGNYFTDLLPPTNDWLCWHKKNDGRTFSEFELAWTNLGKQARLISHHWSHEQKQHITMKPSPVMDWCCSFLEKEAKIIDVYAGSGSTLLAADRAGQTAYGVELDPKYVDVILDRLERQTGQTAKLVSKTP
jgi:site-specific DNA-methyltransferase (adenine-specific)